MIILKEKKAVLGCVLALVSAVAYGAYPIIAKFALASAIPIGTILFLRFAICIFFLWIYAFIVGKTKAIDRKTALKLMAVGAVPYSLMSSFYLVSISLSSASLSSMILCTYPIFVVLMSVIMKKEPMSSKKAVALVLCVAGLFFLLDVSAEGFRVSGVLFAFAASFCYTAYVLVGNHVSNGAEPIVAATYIMSGVCAAGLVSGLVTSSLDFSMSAGSWISIAALAVISTALPMVLFWVAISMIGASKSSMIGTAEPMATVFLAAAILHESLTAYQMLGAVLVVACIILIQME